MTANHALQFAFALSLFGALFSGVLTYRELLSAAAVSYPAPGAPGTLLGYPACDYGFLLFLTLTAVSTAGLWGRRGPTPGRGIEWGGRALGVRGESGSAK